MLTVWILQHEITKNLKRLISDKNNVFVLLPTLKSVINEIEKNEDGESENQDQKLKLYLSEKEYLRNHYVNIVKPIVIRYEGRYLSLLSNNNESLGISDDENMEINIGNYANFEVCCVLNTMVWPTLQESSKDDENLLLQLKFCYLFAKFNNMEVYNPVSIELLINGCSDIVQYVYSYFNIEHTVPMKLWSKLLIIRKNNEHLKDIMLLLELCLCTTFSNTTLGRFSHLKVVTTQFRSKLLARSLNSIMRKRIKGVSLEEFNRDYATKCADF